MAIPSSTLLQWATALEQKSIHYRQWADGFDAAAQQIRAYLAQDPDQPEDPGQPPPPSGDGVFGEPVYTWREGSSIWTGVGINAPQIAAAGIGQNHIRTIYINGEQWIGIPGYVARAKAALREGAVALDFDLESHLLARGPAELAALYQAVRGILPSGWAPKAYLDHLMSSWNMTYSQAVQWCQQTSDFMIPWIYNKDGSGWLGIVQQLRQAGYSKPMILLGELYRYWDGCRPWTAADVELLLRSGQTVAGFLPDASFRDSPDLVKASPSYQHLVKVTKHRPT